jgi:ubiquitin conjugation factor E4 B
VYRRRWGALTSCHRFAPPDTLTNADKDTIVTFILVFLSPNYVNNPFLKAKLMTVGFSLRFVECSRGG